MARRLDPGEIETEKLIADIERRIKIEYTQAEREIAKKVEDYYKKYDIKLETWERWVRERKRKQEDFEQWRLGQIAVGRRWEDLRDQLAHDLHNTDQIARSIARGYMPEVYALNHNYGTFECEKGSGIDTSYTLYSRETVENMFRDNPQMLPEPGARVSRKIAEGKAIRWNEKNIQSVMTQAVLQGNNISDIATRLHNAMGPSFTEDDIKDAHKKDAEQIASELARKNRQAAIRNARTMATGAQNRGRQDAYRRAQSKGIETRQMWLASHDMRTRHAHRQLDYVTKDLDEPFENEFGQIMYPGDPTADPANVYNCFTGNAIICSDSEISRSYKHDYSGDLYTIETSSGVKFSCTPNHPILTPGGWVRAQFLHKGDDLAIARVIKDDVLRIYPNIDHAFSRIDAVHELFEKMGGERTSSLCVNFHGDAPTSDVEIIRKKRFLRIHGNPGKPEHKDELRLKHSRTLASGTSHFIKCFRRITASSFSLMRRLTKALSFFGRSLSHSCKHGFRTVPDVDARLSQSEVDGIPANTEFFSKGFGRFSSHIFFDDIVSVNINPVTHIPVYNLQTEKGYYFVNANTSLSDNEKTSNCNFVIAHNCRCTLRAVVEGLERRSGTSGNLDMSQMDGMDYETWKASRVEKPKPILRPDQRQDQARDDWIRAYRERDGYVSSGRDTTLDIDARKKGRK